MKPGQHTPPTGITSEMHGSLAGNVGDVSATCRFVANLDLTCVSGPTHNSKIAEPTPNLCVGYPYIRTHIYVPKHKNSDAICLPMVVPEYLQPTHMKASGRKIMRASPQYIGNSIDLAAA